MDTLRRISLPLAFAALALVWGSSFLFMKVAAEGLTAGQIAAGRLVLGALTLRVLMVVTERAWPRDRRFWGHMAVTALFLCAVPFLLFAWAAPHIPSGLSSIFNASTPIMAALFTAAILPTERLGQRGASGVALGAAGVVVVVGPWTLAATAGAALEAQLACLGATACYGFGTAYLRRFVAGRHHHDALTVSTVQVSLAAAAALVLMPLTGWAPMRFDAPMLASLAALGILGTGIAYIWFTLVVTAWGAVAASTVTYLTPLVGVLLGVAVLGETLAWHHPVGGAMILAGIIVAQSRRVRPAGRTAEPAPRTVTLLPAALPDGPRSRPRPASSRASCP
ncbi:DMT family transporter [Zafaria sp. J156]|uniref:DMT family transporter n=1 Tax=Zafaria sp. J156 TaxID=3116490 RepID=UPI002E791BEF|nr:DMT family transporter [Zafaria sp. J156]MEE1621581.1 DMT family transporter [Zafaria sp. J156]